MRRLCIVALACVLCAAAGAARGPHAAAATTQPNIVFILTDDQRWDELAHMPTVNGEIRDKGLKFKNFFVPNSLCCPSRSSILTGNYSHTTDIYANNAPHGGFVTFNRRGEEQHTVATALQAAGYETAMMGKYLNGYGTAQSASPTYVPPGWDEWDAFLLPIGDAQGGYFDYKLSMDGTVKSYGSMAKDYSTDVFGKLASSWIDSVPSNKPLFLWLAPRAPHSPATPPPRYGSCMDQTNPDVPSFNVVTPGQPHYLQVHPVVSPASMEALRNKRCGSLRAVDDLVATTIQALTDSGRLDNTILIFMSDNGYELGEHRWNGKQVPYSESIRVPFFVRWDGHIKPGTTDAIGLNVDIAQTLADEAGATMAPNDGHSLLPILNGRKPARWRSDFPLEHWTQNKKIPDYCGVRSLDWMYTQYGTGERELYDERNDPYEVHNLANDPAAAKTLAAMIARMHADDCALPTSPS